MLLDTFCVNFFLEQKRESLMAEIVVDVFGEDVFICLTNASQINWGEESNKF